MEKDDLKLIWKEIHSENHNNNEGDIQKIINMKHSKRVSQILSNRKREMLVCISAFVLFICLMLYALSYLKISLSFISMFIFSFVGMFLFFKTTHSVSIFVILSKDVGKMSLKDSVKSFALMLKRVQKIDFITNLFFFYGLATTMAITFSRDMEGITNSGLIILTTCLFAFLLVIPWLLKRLHSKRYKRFYTNLKESFHDMEDDL